MNAHLQNSNLFLSRLDIQILAKGATLTLLTVRTLEIKLVQRFHRLLTLTEDVSRSSQLNQIPQTYKNLLSSSRISPR